MKNGKKVRDDKLFDKHDQDRLREIFQGHNTGNHESTCTYCRLFVKLKTCIQNDPGIPNTFKTEVEI